MCLPTTCTYLHTYARKQTKTINSSLYCKWVQSVWGNTGMLDRGGGGFFINVLFIEVLD